jgi:hypothetical protein
MRPSHPAPNRPPPLPLPSPQLCHLHRLVDVAGALDALPDKGLRDQAARELGSGPLQVRRALGRTCAPAAPPCNSTACCSGCVCACTYPRLPFRHVPNPRRSRRRPRRSARCVTRAPTAGLTSAASSRPWAWRGGGGAAAPPAAPRRARRRRRAARRRPARRGGDAAAAAAARARLDPPTFGDRVPPFAVTLDCMRPPPRRRAMGRSCWAAAGRAGDDRGPCVRGAGRHGVSAAWGSHGHREQDAQRGRARGWSGAPAAVPRQSGGGDLARPARRHGGAAARPKRGAPAGQVSGRSTSAHGACHPRSSASFLRTGHCTPCAGFPPAARRERRAKRLPAHPIRRL